MENMSTNKDINNEKISSKNNHVNFRSLLYEIIEDGNFPDGSFDCEHIEKAYNVGSSPFCVGKNLQIWQKRG